jgi:hypothetical protein
MTTRVHVTTLPGPWFVRAWRERIPAHLAPPGVVARDYRTVWRVERIIAFDPDGRVHWEPHGEALIDERAAQAVADTLNKEFSND